ncbi:hypothetical protein [Amycolatopsis cihanbeyliensis]
MSDAPEDRHRATPCGPAPPGQRRPGRGVGDRPRPGTRVRIEDRTRDAGRLGTVTYYEGQWRSSTFPVRLDHNGVTGMYLTTDVVELPNPPH